MTQLPLKRFILIPLFLFVLLIPQTVYAKYPKPKSTKVSVSKYKRIVSLKPNITQILMSLGASDQIVGITKFCPKPNGTAQVVGDYNNIDVEAVIRLKPDLVLISSENSQSRQFAALQGAKLRVKLFEFRNYDEMKASLMAIGKLIGLSAKAQTIVKEMDDKLYKLEEKFKGKPTSAKLFIVIVQRQPLMVASGQTYISTLFETAGLKNVFHFNKIAYPVLDQEELIREMSKYTFELSHDPSSEDKEFLNKAVIPLKIENYLASPQSVDHLVTLFRTLN